MKKQLKITGSVVFQAIFAVAFIISLSMISYSASAQDKVRQQGDKMTELLDRLEKGENITLEDLKSAFGEGNMSFVPELPPLPEFPHHSFDFSFRYSDRCDSVPGFVDEWYSQEFREEISKAMEEARKSFEKFRDVDWQIIQEEIRKSMENMRRDMDYLREKYRNEKENQPARKGISII